jgi:hypothetical protein
MTTLAVITSAGNVYGCNVANNSLGPVFEFSGSKIGYNPQDKFMVAANNALFVITDTGDVWWTGFQENGTLSPVALLGGSKIGYNPQDRFMVAVDPIPTSQ